MPTKIEWCDETYNPWWGCERVSPACAHCYADTFARRIGMPELWAEKDHRDEHSFRFFGDKHWDEPLKWARTLPEKLGRRPRVFCASMADVFEERPELDEHRVRLYDMILRTPELDWLVLTKRPEFARDWLASPEHRQKVALAYAQHYEDGDNACDWAWHHMEHGPRNVWMGVSIENSRYTWRADVLRAIPAAVRFISAEPLLGSLFPESAPSRSVRASLARRPISGRSAQQAPVIDDAAEGGTDTRGRAALDLSGIDWVIIGGESGPGARPFHLSHAREIIRVAQARDVVCCQSPPAECCGRPLDSGECCGQPVQGSECCGNFEQIGPGTAVFVKQLGARPVESGERYAAQVAIPIECVHGYDVCPKCDATDVELKLADRKGGDLDEWPEDLRLREWPTTVIETGVRR